MKVKRESLMLIAGAVWIVAGINILIIGLNAYFAEAALSWWAVLLMIFGSFVVLSAFHAMFGKLVKKHVARIRSLEGRRQNPFLFFDVRGYLIMAFMIGLGVTLRMSGTVPDWFIAFFYTGLGTALLSAGSGFLLHWKHGANWTFHHGKPHRGRV